jgi:hypothetical protein
MQRIGNDAEVIVATGMDEMIGRDDPAGGPAWCRICYATKDLRRTNEALS